ncbi:hypothetical protein [Hyalangium rubrum]|uniref:Lipoprotein n=1 Tax=Hyalangium rubrum TaxID=3103134 RepID=A0ABU5H976_9BACT|nr:hypothetical protein [Hyalangium sp. s54d21]MDY7230042.1 hypothetical protein [Hyalangium sp. s54d21]
MTRIHSRLSLVAVPLWLSLFACGSSDTEAKVFQANTEGGTEQSFPEFDSELVGTDPLQLRTCSKDPTPLLADDETTLCLFLDLDVAGLDAAGAPATLAIGGEARIDRVISDESPAFTSAPGHSPVVTAAWATVGCYSRVRQGPLVQQLEGRVVLEQNTRARLAGRVVLSSKGQVTVADCGNADSASFDFLFDLARP